MGDRPDEYDIGEYGGGNGVGMGSSGSSPVGSGFSPRAYPPSGDWSSIPYRTTPWETYDNKSYYNPKNTTYPSSYSPPSVSPSRTYTYPSEAKTGYKGNSQSLTPTTTNNYNNNRPVNSPRAGGEYLGIDSPAGSKTNLNNSYRPTNPSSNNGGMGASKTSAPTGTASSTSAPTGTANAPGGYSPSNMSGGFPSGDAPSGSNSPGSGGASNYQDYGMKPPGSYSPGALPPTQDSFSPSNFDNYFNNFMDNNFSSPVEPPGSPPPFKGGGTPGQRYLVKWTALAVYSSSFVQVFGQREATGSITGFIHGGEGYTWFFKDGSGTGELPWYYKAQPPDPDWVPDGFTIAAAGILEVIPLGVGSDFEDEDTYSPFPGTNSSPNNNFSPSMFMGTDTDTGTDTNTNNDLAPQQHPDANKPAAAPAALNPRTPPEAKPFDNPLNLPNNRPYTPFEPFEFRDDSSRPPSTSNLAPSGSQRSDFTPGAPNGLRDPDTKKPIDLEKKDSNSNEPNPSTTPSHDCENPTDPCQARMNKKLDSIEKNTKKEIDPIIIGSISNVKCSKFNEIDKSDNNFSYSGIGILGLSEQLKAMAEFQKEIKKDICRLEVIAAIPEVWLARYNTAVPQLIVLFAEVKEGKFQKSRYPITIPHYNGKKNPILNPYQKGQWLGVLKLKDNTKLIINGKTANIVKKYVQDVAKMINADFLPENTTIEPSKRANKTKEIKVYPVVARYYKKGVESAEPEWTHYYPLPK